MSNAGGAGHGARTEAQRIAAAADALERKAANARRLAANYDKGAQGELETAHTLAELTVEGWRILHDRQLPHGGNIDHLAVGPGGVVVVDAKAWTGPVRCQPDGRLRAGRYDRTGDVERLAAAASTVQGVLRGAGYTAPVRAALALTTEAVTAETVLPQGPLLVGLQELNHAVRSCPNALADDDVEAVTRCLADAFPAPATDEATAAAKAPAATPEPAGRLFLKANIFLYVEPWSRAGRRRLYLSDEHGTSLGYKDLNEDLVHVTGDADPDTVKAVLRHAHPGGLNLVLPELPRIPIQLPAGRLLGSLGGLWTSFLVAQHWRRGGKDRLYVTHALPGQGIFDLGHIDLAAGTVHPSSTEPLGKDLRPPHRYLELTLGRYPRRRQET